MFFKRKQRKRKDFYHHIELVYNDPTLIISKELRQALLKSVSGLEKGDRIALFSLSIVSVCL